MLAHQYPESSRQAILPTENKAEETENKKKKKAAKSEHTERLFEGAHVAVLKESYKSHFAVGAVLRVEFDDHKEAEQARSGEAALNLHAEPSAYIDRLRGGRPEQLELKPDEVRPISVTEYNAGLV